QPAVDPAGLTTPLCYAQAGDPRNGWFLYQNNVAGAGWDFRMFKNSHLDRSLDISGGDVPVAGTWYFIAVTYDAAANVAQLYVNGAMVASGQPDGYVANGNGNFTIGARSDGAFQYNGSLDEVTFYDHAVPAATLLSHYQNGSSATPNITYDVLIKQESPLLYFRLDEPAFVPPDALPVAANLGSWGTIGDASYEIGTTPGLPGVPGGGFASTNHAVGINGRSGSVVIPAGQNLATDTVTYTAWIKPTATEASFAAVLFQRGVNGGTAVATGFGFGDQNDLRMHWEDTEYDWIPGLKIPTGVWSFITASITPTNSTLSVNGVFATHDATHSAHDFGTDPINIGLDPTGGRVFNGLIDEVAIFDKALTTNQLAALYAAAQLPPAFSLQPVAPTGTLFEGDSLTLTVSAVGSPVVSYAWYQGATLVTNGTSLALPSLTTAASGTYFAVASNPYGTTTSAPVTLTIIAGPPVISLAPTDLAVYPGGTAKFKVAAGGSLPITYQWFHGTVPVAGATAPTFALPEIGTADAGGYSVVTTNPYGSVTNTATLAVLPIDTAYAAQVLSSGPIAYWKLNETSGNQFADSIQHLDGTLNATVTTGVVGPRPAFATGFGTTNTAFAYNGATSDSTAPALNTTAKTMTLTAWFNPAIVQIDLTGLLFCRGTLTSAAGIDFAVGGNLGYTWNARDTTYNWDSGLTPTIGAWNFVALVVEPNQATIYLDAGNGLVSSVNADVVHNPEVFDAVLHIGTDPIGNRLFQGSIDEVAIFGHAMTATEVENLRNAAILGTATTVPVTILQDPAGADTLEGSTVTLAASVQGSQPLLYQWQKDGKDVPGAVRSTLTLASAKAADTGVYQLIVTQGATKATSATASVTIHPTPMYLNITNGLALHLPFDGSVADTSSYKTPATAVGEPTFVTGKIGANALDYKTVVTSGAVSAASYVDLGAPANLAIGAGDDFSVAYWIRFTGLPGDLPFLGNTKNSYGDVGIGFAPSYNQGSWSWNLNDGSNPGIGLYSPTQKNLNDGNWHHLVHVFKRTASALTYLDGTLVNTTDVSALAGSDLTNGGQSWEIGQANDGGYPEPGEFAIDDLGFWRRTLSDYEARAIYIVGSQYGRSFDVPGVVAVALTFQYDGSAVTVGWPSGTLQSAPAVTGPWTDVPGASAPSFKVTTASGAGSVFYRVSY
ncbi:MAG TPA: LamG-like jellyroll fold domain-containing protein, partial [Candidatus Limnocylindria bacterium]|nr:LamG-like jellyroll fold domain-containing protein [Candidatus Limnocylindria bacterium]